FQITVCASTQSITCVLFFTSIKSTLRFTCRLKRASDSIANNTNNSRMLITPAPKPPVVIPCLIGRVQRRLTPCKGCYRRLGRQSYCFCGFHVLPACCNCTHA